MRNRAEGNDFCILQYYLLFFTFKAFTCIQRARKLAFLLISHFILHFVTCAILSDEPKQLIRRYSRSFAIFDEDSVTNSMVSVFANAAP